MKHLLAPAVLIVAMASVALAQTANITVTQIAASGSGGEVRVDPQLSSLADLLPKKFRYSNYDFVARTSLQVTPGNIGTWKLSGGKTLNITLVASEGSGAQERFVMQLGVYEDGRSGRKTIATMTPKVSRGQTWFLGIDSGQPGSSLILAITAQ